MEHDEMAVKSKAKKGATKKVAAAMPVEKEVAPVVIEAYGVTFTLDESLNKYADDPFFIEHTRKVNERFAKAKSKF